MAIPLASLSFRSICLVTILGAFGSATASVAGELPFGYIYHPELKTAYKLSTAELSWSSARVTCESEGARLAVVDTLAELGVVVAQRPMGTWVWVGILKDSLLSSWVAVDGSPIATKLPWALLPLGNTLVGDCVAVSGVAQGLANALCYHSRRYLCEIPGERSTPNSQNQTDHIESNW